MKKEIYFIDKNLASRMMPEIEAKNGNDTARAVAGFDFLQMADNNGVAVIRVASSLTSEFNWCGIDYKTLGASLEMAEEDEKVRCIAFDINSPGGAVNGLFDFCEQIARCKKPTSAFTSGMICSAAYAIASAAGKIYATDTADIGSVGTYMSFIDDSEWLKKAGIKEISFYGKNSDRKNLDPCSEEGKKVYQEQIDKLEGIFIEKVANYRGVTPDYVLANYGHGQVFIGNDAKAHGLVDEVVSGFDEYMEIISKAPSAEPKDNAMAQEEKKVLATSVEGIDPEFLAQIKAEAVAQAKAEAEDEAKAQADRLKEEAVAAERERVAELDKYAALPNADIKAMAEKAKADGTSVEAFGKMFQTKAFELFGTMKDGAGNTAAAELAREAAESAQIDTPSKQASQDEKNEEDKWVKAGEGLASIINKK